MRNMQLSPKLFRWLLVLSYVFGIAGSGLEYVFPDLVPQSLRAAHEQLSAEFSLSHYLIPVVFGVPALILGVVASVGLYLFKPWAPKLALVATALGLAFYPFIDAAPYSGLSAMLTELSTTLWGAVIAIALFSPLQEKFQPQAGKSALPETAEESWQAEPAHSVWADAQRNLVNGTRIAILLPVDGRDWRVSPPQLIVLVIFGLLTNLATTFAINGPSGYFNMWALPYQLLYFPFTLLAGYLPRCSSVSPPVASFICCSSFSAG